MGYVFLTLALVLNACANVLLKIGSTDFAALREEGLMRAVFSNYALLGGLVLFACNIIFYALALSKIPLSIGYPVMTAGGLIIITTISVLYLQESISLLQMVGVALLIVGIILVVFKY